jgi:mitofilin
MASVKRLQAPGLQVVAGAILLSGSAVGGAVAYASVDADFRKLLEDTVPGSDQVLELAIGAPEPAAPAPRPSAPSKLKISSPVVVTKAKTEPPPEAIAAPPMPPLEEPSPVAVKAVAVEAVAEPVAVEAVAEPVAVEAVAKPVAVEAKPMPVEAEPAKAVKPVETAKPAAVAEKEAPAASKTVVKEAAPAVDPSVKAPALAPAPALEDRSQITPDIENSSLELVLEELCQEMAATVKGAVVGHEVSSEAVIQHIGIMQKVLESNLTQDDAMMPTKDDAAWNEMFEAAITKSDAVKAAEIKERAALAAIENVIESIAAGRKNRTTSTNPNLLVAEEAANRAIYQLDQAKIKGSAIQGEAKVMEEYRELVEAGRQQFQKEMASIMPDVKIGEKSGKLTEDELNMFITHAYRKVLFLQQELAKQQTLEQERFKKALEKHHVETQMGASEKIESELERQKRDLELEHERRMAAIRDEAEGEMRAQLRRQAAAHSDHLADVLSVQVRERRSVLGCVCLYGPFPECRAEQEERACARREAVCGGL